MVVMENFFDAHREEPSGTESQRQTRIELSIFDCIDGLPRYVESGGQLGLRPIALSAQDFEPVRHRYRHVP